MAFPTTSVLDDFNRANVGPPPSASWGATVVFSGVGADHRVISNQVGKANTGFHALYWNTPFGDNEEVFMDVAVLPSVGEQIAFLLVRLSAPGGTTDGYGLAIARAAGADTWDFYRIDDNAQNLLSGVTQEVAAGDSIGFAIVDDELQAWYKPAAGAWTMLGTETDATYTDGGYIGFESQGNVARFDNFGGGTINLDDDPPVLTVSPALSGNRYRGQVLSVNTGTWLDASTFAYQWQRDVAGNGVFTSIIGQTANTHTIDAADVGNQVRCRVTATNAFGSTAGFSNAITAGELYASAPAVAPLYVCGNATVTFTEGDEGGTDPINLTQPIASGAPVVGQTVHCTDGTWSGASSFTYQWQRSSNGTTNWTNIGGATDNDYVVATPDIDKYLRCAVTAHE